VLSPRVSVPLRVYQRSWRTVPSFTSAPAWMKRSWSPTLKTPPPFVSWRISLEARWVKFSPRDRNQQIIDFPWTQQRAFVTIASVSSSQTPCHAILKLILSPRTTTTVLILFIG
jgi:hypothetical protein